MNTVVNMKLYRKMLLKTFRKKIDCSDLVLFILK